MSNYCYHVFRNAVLVSPNPNPRLYRRLCHPRTQACRAVARVLHPPLTRRHITVGDHEVGSSNLRKIDTNPLRPPPETLRRREIRRRRNRRDCRHLRRSHGDGTTSLHCCFYS